MSCSYVTQIVAKNTIFGLKMMVKSGLEKSFRNPSMRETILPMLFHILTMMYSKSDQLRTFTKVSLIFL